MAFNLNSIKDNIDNITTETSEFLSNPEYISEFFYNSICPDFRKLCQKYDVLLFNSSIEEDLSPYNSKYDIELLVDLEKCFGKKFDIVFCVFPLEFIQDNSFINEFIKFVINYYGIFVQCNITHIPNKYLTLTYKHTELADFENKNVKLKFQNIIKYIRVVSHCPNYFISNNFILDITKNSILMNGAKDIFDNFIIPIIHLKDEFKLYRFVLDVTYNFMKMLLSKFEIDINHFHIKNMPICNIFSVINTLQDESELYKQYCREYYGL